MEKWLKKHVWNIPDIQSPVNDDDLLISKEWLTFLNFSTFLKQKLYSTILTVRNLRETATVYPNEEDCMRWSYLCEPETVKVVILGQDPYHGGQANGLAFSVNKNFPVPPSLKNIYKEIQRTIPHFYQPNHGCLDSWAEQGVLLLNTTLTVEKGKAGSHLHIGWTWLTNYIISQLSENLRACCFLLWGSKAIEKTNLINTDKHLILKSQHPSPLAQQSIRPSKYPKFIGNNHFLDANLFLESKGIPPIDWTL